MYFLVERSKFTSMVIEQWEIRVGHCHRCGRQGTVTRLAHAPGHDTLHEARVEFSCLDCDETRLSGFRHRGIEARAERELRPVVHDFGKGK